MANVNVDQLASLIARNLEMYTDEVSEKVEKAIIDTSEDTVKSLKENPNIPEQTGKYKKSFYVKNLYKSKGSGKGSYKLVVANKKYRLTHLLENGHAKRGGGRTRAYPHWVDAQAIADTLPDRIKEVIER